MTVRVLGRRFSRGQGPFTNEHVSEFSSKTLKSKIKKKNRFSKNQNALGLSKLVGGGGVEGSASHAALPASSKAVDPQKRVNGKLNGKLVPDMPSWTLFGEGKK